MTVAVIEAGTVYQVAAHVLTTTTAGDVTFVRKFVEFFRSVPHGGLMAR